MDVKTLHQLTLKKIKPSLVFFCFLAFLPACRQEHGIRNLVVHYHNGRAETLSFESDADPAGFRLIRSGEMETYLLGEMVSSGKAIEFIPAIPFQPGQSYEVHRDGQKIGGFIISDPTGKGSPEVLQFYPTTDSVPENLLKLYIQFSMPMQEVGHAVDFIQVRDKSEGQPVDIFLHLESELWNKEHNLLTLWLDPGRIKTGLIPNKAMGLPIKAGHSYSVRISPEWKSATGQPIGEGYQKTYYVGAGDRARPNPADWKLQPPKGNSKDPLKLSFPEPLDAILLPESFHLQDGEGRNIQITFQLGPHETSIELLPLNNWKKGSYTLLIDSILEDLAGNNISRLFDEELQGGNPDSRVSEVEQLDFTIE